MTGTTPNVSGKWIRMRPKLPRLHLECLFGRGRLIFSYAQPTAVSYIDKSPLIPRLMERLDSVSFEDFQPFSESEDLKWL